MFSVNLRHTALAIATLCAMAGCSRGAETAAIDGTAIVEVTVRLSVCGAECTETSVIGAHVTLELAGTGRKMQGQTGDDGVARFRHISQGEWKATASVPDLAPQAKGGNVIFMGPEDALGTTGIHIPMTRYKPEK